MRKALLALCFALASTLAYAETDVKITNEPCGGYPVGAKATGTTGAVTATLTANANSTMYVCHVDVSAIGGTAAIGPITITGTLGGTLTFQGSSSAAGIIQSWNFTPCWPASAVNTNIVVATTADGTATAVDVDALGCMK